MKAAFFKIGTTDRLLAANDKAAALAQDKSKQGHERHWEAGNKGDKHQESPDAAINTGYAGKG